MQAIGKQTTLTHAALLPDHCFTNDATVLYRFLNVCSFVTRMYVAKDTLHPAVIVKLLQPQVAHQDAIRMMLVM